MTPKIQRPPNAEKFFGHDEDSVRLPHTLSHPIVGYEVRFGRTGWKILEEWSEEGEVLDRLRERQTNARIWLRDRLIGKILLREYDVPSIFNSWFWDAMDGHSHSAYELAEVVLSAWPDFTYDVAGYGSVLEINRVWIEPRHGRSGVWIPVVKELLSRVRRRTAIIVAKAYPLEYEGKLPSDAPERAAFERRRRAMFRFYGRHLGLHPLPGRSGEDGWIWRPRTGLENIIESPGFTENWRDPD
jgi:hypothetical protein